MAKEQDVRRGSFRVFFGRATKQWSLGDPAHPLVSQANHRVRYSKPLPELDSGALVLVRKPRGILTEPQP